MIRTRTVFVVGAGASWPFGFPLGPELRHRIVTRTTAPGGEGIRFLIDAGLEEARIGRFRESLSRSWSASIDAFLSSRLDLADVGKAAILYTLAGCEKEDRLFAAEPKYDWFRYLWRFMHADASSAEMFGLNNVAFVTFNYDRSLEHAFTVGLQAAYPNLTEDKAWEYVPRIVHVYGSLGRYPPAGRKDTLARPFGEALVPQRLKELSNAIEVIPEVKAARFAPRENRPLIDFTSERIKDAFRDAKRLVFLGFSYDRDNLDRLHLFTQGGEPGSLPLECQIWGTGMGLEATEIGYMKAYFPSPFGGSFTLGDPTSDCHLFLRRHLDLFRG